MQVWSVWHDGIGFSRKGMAKRKASRDEVIRAIHNELGKVEGVAFRMRDLSVPGSFPRCSYPFDLALSGPDVEKVRKWASQLGKRLAKNE